MNLQHKLNKSLSSEQLLNNNNNISQQMKENNGNNYESKIDLDFYAYGKVNKNYENDKFKLNISFAGGANNLLLRNYLSVNNSSFDKLKSTIPKTISTVFHQNQNENNYLEPFQSYRSEHRYDIPDYGINHGMYNLMKNKLYSKDSNSNIYKGKEISKNDFIDLKKQLININSKTKSSKTTKISSIREKFHNKIKQFINPNNIKDIIKEEKENAYDNLIKEKFGTKKLVHNNSAINFQPINPIDEHLIELKGNDNHFNINTNRNHILKSRNWWKIE